MALLVRIQSQLCLITSDLRIRSPGAFGNGHEKLSGLGMGTPTIPSGT